MTVGCVAAAPVAGRAGLGRRRCAGPTFSRPRSSIGRCCRRPRRSRSGPRSAMHRQAAARPEAVHAATSSIGRCPAGRRRSGTLSPSCRPCRAPGRPRGPSRRRRTRRQRPRRRAGFEEPDRIFRRRRRRRDTAGGEHHVHLAPQSRARAFCSARSPRYSRTFGFTYASAVTVEKRSYSPTSGATREASETVSAGNASR